MTEEKTIYTEKYWRKKMHDIRSAMGGLPGIAELLEDQEKEMVQDTSDPEEEEDSLSSCLYVIANDVVAILNEIRSDMEREKARHKVNTSSN